MKKLEQGFQTKFNKWTQNIFHTTAVFELKYVRGKSFAFSQVQEHQVNALYQARHGTIVFKIPDDSRGQKPFDSFCMSGVPAFVGVMFLDSTPGRFHLIDIDDFIKLKDTHNKKSVTEDQLVGISWVAHLK